MAVEMVADLAQIFSSVAVAGALVFGVIQIRQFKQQRVDAAAIELMRSMTDREFSRSYQVVFFAPQGHNTVPDAEYQHAALSLGITFETMGMLVYRHNIPLYLVEELVGGSAVLLWRKLSPWVETTRSEEGFDAFLEWFQWLAERLMDRERLQQQPSYLRAKDWRPA